MAKKLIADRISIKQRYVRAVDIARDLPDQHALDGYVLTSRAKDALGRLANGVAQDSSQRAFRITGPYGSGKSSFGLLLAKLFEGGSRHADAIRREALGEKGLPALEPLILIGSRTSLARELLTAVASKARDQFGADDKQASLCDQIIEEGGRTRFETRDVLGQLTKLADRLRKSKNRGLVVLIDEMGRFLEYAATNPSEDDPALFQQLAERASGAACVNLSIVAFLHHRFDDYLASNDAWSAKEWARSAERYEEIAFSEPREQSIHLLANALVPQKPHSKPVLRKACSLYEEASDRSLFAIARTELLEVADNLYPLHPASLACLTSAASRFGQHDRSVFSFLQSSEPSGYQHFAHTAPYDADEWYRLDRVFDYMASSGQIRFESRDRDRRWSLGTEAVDAISSDDDGLLLILKTVAVIATLEPVPGLKTDAETLAWSLDMCLSDVRVALDDLTKRGILYRRVASKDYSLWSNTSVDLSRWYAEAERTLTKSVRLNAKIAEIPALRPVIAQRHYHETGTLRSFLVHFGEDCNQLPEGVDGHIVILPVHPDDDLTEMVEKGAELSEKLGPLAMVHLRHIDKDDLSFLYQLNCWKWISETCDELRMDDLARNEVQRNIVSLEQRLQARLSPLAFGTGKEDWFYAGKRKKIESRAMLSRCLSEICREVFVNAPVLRNELINRNKLSSAIAAARMRLLGRMIGSEAKEYLALTGAPPERTIYLSLFHASSMHREVEGCLGFHPPIGSDPLNWRPAWDRVDQLVRADDAVSFELLIGELGKPPYGLRAGPALLLVAAVMLHHRSTVSLIERGTFQPELTEAHFMRLAKNPKHFALKRLAAKEDEELLRKLAAGLSIFSDNRPEPQLKSIVEAIFVWWRGLDDFARITSQIDATAKAVRSSLRKARDPITLLFVDLPKDCGVAHEDKADGSNFVLTLDSALAQLADALPQLRGQAAARLKTAFSVSSLASIRRQIRLDYQDHLLELGDYKLRAFVDRAMNKNLDDELWLDGVASLLIGKRLESWNDTMLDQFGFEVYRMAQTLARRLAVIREAKARKSPVTAIHITSSNGDDRSYFLRDGSHQDDALATEIRKMIARHERPEALLIEALQALLAKRDEEMIE